jgi:hypothetical protein
MRVWANLCLMTMLAAAGCTTVTWDGHRPYRGGAHAIPGLIEAEHYDIGPPGYAYADVDPENHGVDYRRNTQVDIEARDDASNGHGIGWTRASEWLAYTVSVRSAGTYLIEMPVASNGPGGIFHIEMDGIDVTDQIVVPDTGGWDKLLLIQVEGVVLDKGLQVMKVVMDTEGESGSIGDIDYFHFRKTD